MICATAVPLCSGCRFRALTTTTRESSGVCWLIFGRAEMLLHQMIPSEHWRVFGRLVRRLARGDARDQVIMVDVVKEGDGLTARHARHHAMSG